ncbi:hypothetical protein [Paraburkholderia rhynchosiae]|uniref:Uncharacterized protein n=1 Tax=Paraburkholderia rhynchosiae TaxID=487049 RepID=A0A6J5CDN3_9BURK|nr:hypothetical protein [Paraburkholderia rhynchosiae]CAB3732521.1 hypothetical protein LMG27174_05943 [Paraburkholderia rhynchosiae]
MTYGTVPAWLVLGAIASITAWQVGMYGLMAIIRFLCRTRDIFTPQ